MDRRLLIPHESNDGIYLPPELFKVDDPDEALQLFARVYLGGDVGLRFMERFPDLYKNVSVDAVTQALKNLCDKGAQSLFPKNEIYQGLQKAYHDMSQKSQKDDPVFDLKETLNPNQNHPLIPKVRHYLAFYGYPVKDMASTVYDADLEAQVKRFQEHHRESADGVIGGRTQALFRMTFKKRLDTIRLNMARLRALCFAHDLLNQRDTDADGERYILVNVAAYEVYAMERDVCTLSMKAIVGQPSRKTPLFFSTLQYLVFNPTWTIPGGILMKDKVPRMMNDPGYAAKIGQLTGVDPYSVDWSDPSSRPSITYPPGAGNPLGRVKFFIQNKGAIYMHDTDKPELFQKEKRALSSGCVRLEKPLDLVAWLDKNGPYNTKEKVEAFLSKNKRTQSLEVNPDVPCYFVYLTAQRGSDGFVWYSDPYGYDP